MLVMPTWRLERTSGSGHSKEVSACAALALPCGAIWARRARLELTMAISDIATTPLSRINVTRK
jgi:hypothetical protein